METNYSNTPARYLPVDPNDMPNIVQYPESARAVAAYNPDPEYIGVKDSYLNNPNKRAIGSLLNQMIHEYTHHLYKRKGKYATSKALALPRANLESLLIKYVGLQPPEVLDYVMSNFDEYNKIGQYMGKEYYPKASRAYNEARAFRQAHEALSPQVPFHAIKQWPSQTDVLKDMTENPLIPPNPYHHNPDVEDIPREGKLSQIKENALAPANYWDVTGKYKLR